MSIDLENEQLVTTKLKELIKELQKDDCTSTAYDEANKIIKKIVQDEHFYNKYKELYEEIEDELMFAAQNLEKCHCDPIKHKPKGI